MCLTLVIKSDLAEPLLVYGEQTAGHGGGAEQSIALLSRNNVCNLKNILWESKNIVRILRKYLAYLYGAHWCSMAASWSWVTGPQSNSSFQLKVPIRSAVTNLQMIVHYISKLRYL